MNVHAMQRIDYWLGVPLCAIFSIFDRARNFFRPPSPRSPKKVLFIELSEMGSAILAYSALRRAETEFGLIPYFLIFRRNRESLDLLGLIPTERVLVIADSNLLAFAFSVLRAVWQMWRNRIDTTVDMELFSRCTALLSYMSGARNRVGFDNGPAEGLYRGSFITHRVLYNPHQHISVNFLNLLYSLFASHSERPHLKRNLEDLRLPLPQFPVEASSRESMRAMIHRANPGLKGTRYLVFNPDPGLLPLRGWPLEKFVELARRCIEEIPESAVFVVGLGRSKSYADAIGAVLPGDRFVDLTGKTRSLAELVVLFQLSAALITNDSGPAHFASLTDLPTLVLFGPETPRLYGPLGKNVRTFFAGLGCSPCYAAYNHRQTRCNNNVCLQAISVERVLSELKTAVQEGGGS